VTGSTIDARYRETPPVHGITRWSLIRLRDPQTWLDALHSVVQLPLAVVTWSVTLVWWAAAISGPTYIVWARFLPDARPIAAPAELLTWVTRLIVGVAAGVTLPWVLRTATWAHQALASMLLASGSAEALAERIAQLEGNKAAATRAEVQSLRRLERDIHDGPQQSLVRLTMDIASAERAVGRDDETALRLLASARTVATDALAELRALSRGIAPPVLAERGLRSAIESLAGRTLVPTQVTWNASVDLGVGAETTAYFVVAEALANAAKHAQPSAISLAVSAQDGRLVVTVSDDGLGGAHMSKGHGLAGLAERVAGAGGTLTVADAVSGGTVVTAEVPCA
jgi:signal transduction histidine kinase